jgi:hypothetical protein
VIKDYLLIERLPVTLALTLAVNTSEENDRDSGQNNSTTSVLFLTVIYTFFITN